MTTFEDGPAHGVTLMLKRSPYFLRVTYDGKYDALDQWDDVPRPNETLTLYRITAAPGWCHIRAAKGAGGIYSTATYALAPSQPGDAILRDNERFAKWCGEQTEDINRWAEMLEKKQE